MTRTDVEGRLTERLTRLAAYAAATPSTAPATVELVSLPATRRRRRPVWAIAAGMAVILAVSGLTIANSRHGTDRSATPHATVTGRSPAPATSFDRGEIPPKLTLPGWTNTTTQTGSTPGAPDGSRLFLVVEDPERGFDGPRIKVGVTALPEGFSAGPTPQHVNINGTTAELGAAPDKVYLTWSPAPGRTVFVEGTHASPEQVLTVARGLHLAPDLTSATATVAPHGLRVTPLEQPPAAAARWAEYRFIRGEASLQVNLYPGGRTTFEDRLGDPSRNIAVRGTTGAVRDAGVNRFWVDLLDGRWTVEVAGGPFTSEAEFIAAVDALGVTG